MSKANQALTWLQVNNWVPIISAAIMLTVSFGALSTQIALLNQKMDNLVETQKTMIVKYDSLLAEINSMEQRMSKVETDLKNHIEYTK